MTTLPPFPFVVFDVETTGLRIGVDRVCQVGVIRVEEDREIRMAELVNPEMDIPAEATAIHGITTEMARAGDVLAAVAPRMARLFAGASCVVGFNVRGFDVPFVQEDLVRVGAEDFLAGLPVVDLMQVDWVLRPRTLDGVFAHWLPGVAPRPRHGAIQDALDTLDLLRAMPIDVSHPELIAAVTTPEHERGILDPHRWFRRRDDGVVVMNRGKHAGMELMRAPLDYLQWMAEADEMPPRTVRTVKAVIEKRRSAR